MAPLHEMGSFPGLLVRFEPGEQRFLSLLRKYGMLCFVQRPCEKNIMPESSFMCNECSTSRPDETFSE